MSLRGKFRLLLAIFGISIAANVLVSLWCIQVYMRAATRRFELLMLEARGAEDLRTLADETATSLRARVAGSSAENATIPEDAPTRWAAALATMEPTGDDEDRQRARAELAALVERLQVEAQRIDRLVAEGRNVEAQRALDADFQAAVLAPFHRALADYVRTSDVHLTRTSADVADTQARVTALLGVNALVAFLVAALGFKLVRSWVLRPLEGLKSAVERHAGDDLAYRIPPPYAADELGTLAQALNRMAASLLEGRDRLVQQERLAAIGELASSIAHNIRNPLASIRANVQAAIPELPEHSSMRAQADEIIATVDSLSRWLRELLMVSRPIELDRRPLAVDRVVAPVMAVMASEAARRAIVLAYAPAGEALRVNVDAPRIEQALLAVLDNAVEASPAGGRVLIEARAAESGGWVEVVVSDGGPGLAPEVQARVATAYFSTKPGGTGIGTHLARRIVQAHGGDLAFGNRAEGGTMVAMRLPRADAAAPGV
jgi:signal transduction histidine kinase